jgi:hypothetical protein
MHMANHACMSTANPITMMTHRMMLVMVAIVAAIMVPTMVLSMPSDIDGLDSIMLTGPATPAPRHIINLDLPGTERWKEIAVRYLPNWAPIMAWLDKLVPPDIEKKLEPYLGNAHSLPYYYASRMCDV